VMSYWVVSWWRDFRHYAGLDDAFIDDSVALNVKSNLQEQNPLAANRSFFVVPSAAHLPDRVIPVRLDDLDKVIAFTHAANLAFASSRIMSQNA
jgi:hypothetical protein